MSESQMLTRLASWYIGQCNGLWEHSYGILIDTLDNPGWSVKVDLDETPFQDVVFEPIKFNKSQDDWFFCHKKGRTFVGSGDPSKLVPILEIFLKFVGK